MKHQEFLDKWKLGDSQELLQDLSSLVKSYRHITSGFVR